MPTSRSAWEGGARTELTVKLNARGPDRHRPRRGHDRADPPTRRAPPRRSDRRDPQPPRPPHRAPACHSPRPRPRRTAPRRHPRRAATGPDLGSRHHPASGHRARRDRVHDPPLAATRACSQASKPRRARRGESGSPTRSAPGSCPTSPTGSSRSTTPRALLGCARQTVLHKVQRGELRRHPGHQRPPQRPKNRGSRRRAWTV